MLASSSPLYSALNSYIDVPFIACLSGILVLTCWCATRRPALLLLAVFATSAVILLFDRTSTTKETIKVLAELPLGLGSVLAFVVLPDDALQARLLPPFTAYVNVAVYGNIGMMVATPAGATWRGACCKVACLALTVWVVQQGRRVGWKTIRLPTPRQGSDHDRNSSKSSKSNSNSNSTCSNMFIFTAVDKPWILAHAVYRAVLLTLPCFGSGRRHRLLEPYSLAMTFALSRASGLKFEHCFGMADTLVVASTAGWATVATVFDLVPRDGGKGGAGSNRVDTLGPSADVCLSVLVLSVAAFACYNVARGSWRVGGSTAKSIR